MRILKSPIEIKCPKCEVKCRLRKQVKQDVENGVQYFGFCPKCGDNIELIFYISNPVALLKERGLN